MSLERIHSFAPLPIRIIAGIAFIIHGLSKLSNVHGTQGFFGSLGLPPELALPISLLEIIGGVVLLLGLLTRIASILFVIEMMSTTFVIKFSHGFSGPGGFEVDLLLLSIVISLLISGPGRVSIERDVLKREIFPKINYKQKQ
ncbi:MAG: DoxX family protein [Candidatus Nitrosocosmicus sp.]